MVGKPQEDSLSGFPEKLPIDEKNRRKAEPADAASQPFKASSARLSGKILGPAPVCPCL